MVHRRVTRAAAFLAAIGSALLISVCAVAPAQANNTRVSIHDFQWSNKNPHVDLGESVTWDWIGPDTQHSVSGDSPNSTQWDSDPDQVKSHPLGDTFTVVFDQPGDYVFQCKLHNSVRGTVSVSNTPGDPNSDPGPQESLHLDYEAPFLDQFQLMGGSFVGPNGKGTGLKMAVSEDATLSADYYKLVKRGKGKNAKTVRMFRGYTDWSTHIGFNTVALGERDSNFEAKPGKYVALVYAADANSNVSSSTPVKFQVSGKKK